MYRISIAVAVIFLSCPLPRAEEVPCPFSASSTHPEDFSPEFAFDNDPKTRWASRQSTGDEWLQIDFGKKLRIPRMCIVWEAAHAIDYEVQLSNDGANWKSIYHQQAGAGGKEELNDLQGKGRWLRILCHQPTQYQLYSIWDISFPDAETAEALAQTRARLEAARNQAAQAARQQLRSALAQTGLEKIAFATRPMYADGHWYANISYYAENDAKKTYARGGGLYVLSLDSGEVLPLVEDPEGTLRDPALHYDGKTILFSWRKGGTDPFHLYTIQSDGSGLTQLTTGAYDDIEPAWLPDGGIAFVSSRCRRWVNCWLTQVAVIHRCDADGKNIVPLSANLEQDNTPWPLPDGRLLYTRWEYIDRSQVDYHHLWTMNPDGAAQTVFFGNMHPGGLFIDAKPVPGGDDVVFINSPGHGAREHEGRIALVNVKTGPDNLAAIRNITGLGYRDPYPLMPGLFLAARGKQLVLLNDTGVEDTLYQLGGGPLQLHEPRPLLPRNRERLIPVRTNPARETGQMILSDVYHGRNMQGVAPGEIKRLLVLEALPKPINYTGGMDPLSYGGTFTLERILGAVPVEEDGSAYFELPANRALFFVALDEKGDSIKRMQSFCSVMPGETLSCVGCHEARSTAGPSRNEPFLRALQRKPSKIKPIPGIPEVFDFPRDIQPILDRHCLPCHDYTPHPGADNGPRAGGVILSGDHGPMFSHSYATLTVRQQFVDGRDLAKSNLAPRSIGSGASPLMQKIRGGHHNVKLSDPEIEMIRGWIETGAPYPGTYAALGNGSIGGYYENKVIENDSAWPESAAAAEAIARRCDACHTGDKRLPKNLSDENELSFWRPDNWRDPRLLRTRHLVFNLSRPENSLILLAPLAPEAGGYGRCGAAAPDGQAAPVFASPEDPDYQAILAMCAAGKRRLEEIKRFDMPGFRPPAPYLREMIRYGVLPPGTPPDAPIDFYQTDHDYWQSFTWPAALQHPAYRE